MLEITQETLEKVEPLLDAGETDSAVELLLALDRISLRALFIHLWRERGAAVAERVAAAYQSAAASMGQRPKAV